MCAAEPDFWLRLAYTADLSLEGKFMKRKIVALSFIALFAPILLLQGCSSYDNITDVAGKTYTYTVEPESGLDLDRFTIRLNTDGTFTYFETVYSSYLGIGNWSVEGDVLTLADDYYSLKNSFRIEGDDLIFIENGSTNFIYVKVSDGEHFTNDDSIANPMWTVMK